MKPIVQLYWLRTAMGVIAAALSAVLSYFLSTAVEPISVLLYSISLALLIYLLTFRIFKAVYQTKVEKPSKIATTAIGMYFFSWLAFYVLFYTIIIVATGGTI
jgi:glucan phosphoethanolaminetransferase (alkaline phosphatase superfamily)